MWGWRFLTCFSFISTLYECITKQKCTYRLGARTEKFTQSFASAPFDNLLTEKILYILHLLIFSNRFMRKFSKCLHLLLFFKSLTEKFLQMLPASFDKSLTEKFLKFCTSALFFQITYWEIFPNFASSVFQIAYWEIFQNVCICSLIPNWEISPNSCICFVCQIAYWEILEIFASAPLVNPLTEKCLQIVCVCSFVKLLREKLSKFVHRLLYSNRLPQSLQPHVPPTIFPPQAQPVVAP